MRHEMEKGFESGTPASWPKHSAHFYHTMDMSRAEFPGVKEEGRYQTYCSRLADTSVKSTFNCKDSPFIV